MDETYARAYSDKLANDLYDFEPVIPEDIAFYTEEADKHIAKMLSDAEKRQQARQEQTQ